MAARVRVRPEWVSLGDHTVGRVVGYFRRTVIVEFPKCRRENLFACQIQVF